MMYRSQSRLARGRRRLTSALRVEWVVQSVALLEVDQVELTREILQCQDRTLLMSD